ncbi:MAG: type transporter [Herbinix sp.]|jgi:multidrug/hemolysin transport system permease protein|nr:type transporter [Herbinix sp.]
MLLLRLIQRNILVYSRNRANIFFSLLSMIIIIGLMLLFLADMNTNNLVEMLSEFGGERNEVVDRENAKQIVILWTLAGLVVVNSITITLAMVGIMIEDEAEKRLSSFYVSPVNRGIFVMGYVCAAIIMGIIMCTLTVIVGEIYILNLGGELFSFGDMMRIMLYIVLNVFSSASLVFLIANFVHSLGAFSGLSTIIGTLVGFLAGIYLPIGMLPEKVQMLLKMTPMLYGCSFLRDIMTENIIGKTFIGCPDEFTNGYKEYMGMTVRYDQTMISNEIKMLILLISGIVFILISALIQRKRNVMSR